MDERMEQEIYIINEQEESISIGTPYNTYSYDNGNNKKSGKKKSRKTSKKIGTFILAGFLFGSAAGGMFQLTNYIGNAYLNDQTAEGKEGSKAETADSKANTKEYAAQQVSSVSTSSGSTYNVTQVAEVVMPSIVSITNQSVEDVQSMFQFGYAQTYETESSGSGIIIGKNDSELLIATNNHVVEGANSLTVCFTDDSVVEAKVKGTDSINDLAVIAVNLEEISEDTLGEISVAVLGNSDDLLIGEQVVAIGNALGYGQSVTTGIVSALNREIAADDMSSSTYIQTDTAINAGNSGGALVNMKGEVIGINTAKISGDGVEGMGFAIPMSAAESIINNLMEQTTREKVSDGNQGYLGISGVDVTSEAAEVYEMPMGVYVNSVNAGSAAEGAGLQAGDIITHIDGSQILDLSNLRSRLTYYAAGETVTFTVQRKGELNEYTEQVITVILKSADEADQGQIANNGNSHIGN